MLALAIHFSVSHRKAEALSPIMYKYLSEAERRIEEDTLFYNKERTQKRLNKLTPVKYRRQLAT